MLKYTMIRLRRNYLALFGLFILVVLIVCAIFADQLAPFGYAQQDYMMILPPCTGWVPTSSGATFSAA